MTSAHTDTSETSPAHVLHLLKDAYIELVPTLPAQCRKHDTSVIHEVLGGDAYRLLHLRQTGKTYDVLVDVGSNIGTVTSAALALGIVKSADCFEINPDSAAAQRRVYDLAHFPFCNVVRQHVGHASPAAVCDVVEGHISAGRTILLKMDVEGWEYPILQEMEVRGQFRHIADMVMELHDPKGQACLDPDGRRKLIKDTIDSIERTSCWKLFLLTNFESTMYLLLTVSSYGTTKPVFPAGK